MNHTIGPSLLDFHSRQKGVYSWAAIGEILGTNKGTAWEIAHGKRNPTQEQIMRWMFWETFGSMQDYHTIPAIPCPTCGDLHQADDCHGVQGQVVIVPAGARIVQPKPPSPRRIQDMSLAELAAAIRNRTEIS